LTLLTAIVGTCLNIYFVVILRKGALGSLQAGVITAILLYLSYLILMLKEIIFTFRWEFVFRGLLFGLPLLPHDLGGWILNLSDRILMQRLASKEELGLYALGCNLSLALGLVTLAINNAWAPFFLSVAEKKEGPPIISKLMTYYLFFICFIALGMSVFSKEITYIMAASDYREAHKVIPLIVLSYIFQGMYFMATNCLFLKEKTKYLPFITFSAAATNFVLNLLWIPRYGMMGAAGATVIAFVLYFLITFFVSKRFYVLSYEKERVTKIFLAAIILYLISTAIRTKSLAYSLSLKTVLLFGYFLGLFLLRFFNKDEITKIKIYFGFTNSSKI
jgi:O-antigen/teichoic acid export membrane protein